MLFSNRIQRAAGQGRCAGPRRVVHVARAARPGSGPELSWDGPESAMDVLASRMAALRRREARAAAEARVLQERRALRPDLPEGATYEQDAALDAKLISRWHDESWASLKPESSVDE